MRNEIVKNKRQQTKHENLGGEKFRVLNLIMHCINYSNV